MNRKKLLYVSALFAVLLLLAGCGSGGTENAAPDGETESEIADAEREEDSGTAALEDVVSNADEAEENQEEDAVTDTLVVYFSRIGEQYAVGVIEEGNTAIVAAMVAERTGADVLEITPAEDNYPTDNYRALTDMALQEQKDGARPAVANEIENFADYDTVFLGYPIWWNDLPMLLYTFLETHDFSGKTVIPFCTHGGSGLAGTEAKIKGVVTADAVLNGLAIAGTDAQNHRDSVRETVNNWLDGLGY